jgi:hypothetical protein
VRYLRGDPGDEADLICVEVGRAAGSVHAEESPALATGSEDRP